MNANELLNNFPIISDQIEPTELRIMLNHLASVMESSIGGDVVEFGCYLGTASLFIQRMLRGKKQFHVYDSFAGLPEKTALDASPAGQQFQPGKLSASKKQLITNFKKAGLPLPIIHKGWFKDLVDEDLPEKIAFAFLDGDYYESIIHPLNLISKRLVSDAVVIVDDYQNEALPGAAKAVDKWLQNKPAKLRIEQSLAIIRTD
jgi:O-methyltransferase